MSNVGQIERKTQDRVVELFRDRLDYEYLGNWEYREGNSNVEVQLLDTEPRSPRLRRQPDQQGDRQAQEAMPRSAVAAICTRPTVTSTACCATA